MSFEDDLRNDPKALARKYSFYPNNPSFAEWTFSKDQVKKTTLSGQYTGFNRLNVKEDYLIAYVKLEIGMTDRGESMIVKPSYAGAGGVPVYFLPWDNRGAAVRMSIPNLDPAKSEDEHPKLFFTAVLSGCSIIFKGTAQQPTIYHCGTEGGEVGTPTQGNSNVFFRNMLTGPGYRAVGGQINSTDYMNPPRTPSQSVVDMETNFLDALLVQKLRRRGIVVKEVSAWGAAFGIRNGRDWKFYLQKNGTISYTKIEEVTQTKDIQKKTFFGLGSKTVTTQYITTKVTHGNRVARPIELEKVFPGAGVAKATPTWNVLAL